MVIVRIHPSIVFAPFARNKTWKVDLWAYSQTLHIIPILEPNRTVFLASRAFFLDVFLSPIEDPNRHSSTISVVWDSSYFGNKMGCPYHRFGSFQDSRNMAFWSGDGPGSGRSFVCQTSPSLLSCKKLKTRICDILRVMKIAVEYLLVLFAWANNIPVE